MPSFSKEKAMPLVQRISLKFLFCLVLLLPGCGFLSEFGKPPPREVKSLGKLTVGKLVPGYAGGSRSGKAMGAKPSRGDYLIHLLHPKLPTECVDEECGVAIDLERPRKKQLYGSSDLKLADQIFGIFPASNEEFRKQSQNYGVVVISDRKGEILSIFNHVQLSDVAKVMKRQNL
jgi:hypothetical protein